MSPCVCRFTFKMTRARQDAEGPQSCWEGGDLSWLPPLHPPATGVREMAALASVLATGWIRWGPGRGGANEKASPSPAASSRHCRCQARKGVWPGPCVPRGREGWCPASHRLRPHGVAASRCPAWTLVFPLAQFPLPTLPSGTEEADTLLAVWV